jgi:hypothetical protein
VGLVAVARNPDRSSMPSHYSFYHCAWSLTVAAVEMTPQWCLIERMPQ